MHHYGKRNQILSKHKADETKSQTTTRCENKSNHCPRQNEQETKSIIEISVARNGKCSSSSYIAKIKHIFPILPTSTLKFQTQPKKQLRDQKVTQKG